MRYFYLIIAAVFSLTSPLVNATTKGLSQIVTPDLQPAGDLSLSFQVQSLHIANPYELQAELGLTKFAEIAVFKGFEPNELIFGTEIGLLNKEPYLLSVGFINWSPHSHVDPQPFIEAGYYTEHDKMIVGAVHAAYKNEAIVGYAHDFNKQWRVQIDFQSGTENSSTIGFTWNITPDFQVNPLSTFLTTTQNEAWATSSLPIPFTYGLKIKRNMTRLFPVDSSSVV